MKRRPQCTLSNQFTISNFVLGELSKKSSFESHLEKAESSLDEAESSQKSISSFKHHLMRAEKKLKRENTLDIQDEELEENEQGAIY